MSQKILISAQGLHKLHQTTPCVIFDCRFALDDPDAGYQDYLKSHIPGAVYAHLDDDLSSPVTVNSGRHPLPYANKFAAFLGRSGWQPGVPLIAYDASGGAIAARLWWLMKYFGQDDAAILDGGIAAWIATGHELQSGQVSVVHLPATELTSHDDLQLSTADVVEGLTTNEIVLVDARAPERFRGEVEPIDSVAGHIPGSVNYPLNRNLDPNGRFKTAHEIRGELEIIADGQESQQFVHMCGSGVTACHNIFAAELAGLQGSKLYVGSWSEWIRDPSRPVI